MKDIHQRLSEIKPNITSEAFRQNKGLGNEIGFHIFDYEPEYEILVRDYIHNLKRQIQRDHDELKIKELQRFFKLSSLSVLENNDFLVQYNWIKCDDSIENRVNANAWVQTGINLGINNECNGFDRKKLSNSLDKIITLASMDLEEAIPELHDILSDCGISLVLLPKIKNSNVKGATKWLSKEKVVLVLVNTFENKRTFWYSFFHELGHVFQKRIKLLLVSNDVVDLDDALVIRLEKEADAFAEKMMALVK